MLAAITSPTIILVKPQLGENIGTSARAMANGGLTSMRLVAPRNGWPNPYAFKPSAGALHILEQAQIFETTSKAIEDLHLVYATTARSRHMNKAVFTPKEAMQNLYHAINKEGCQVGIMFGPERTGLENEDLSLVDGLINVPLNPDFTSLNLAQAVLIMAYEWFQRSREHPLQPASSCTLATKEEIFGLFDHLENELDASGFLRTPHKRPIMVRNIRNMLQKAPLTSQEVRTLRGIIASLAHPYFKDSSGE